MEVGFIFWRCRWYDEKQLFSSASFGGFGPLECKLRWEASGAGRAKLRLSRGFPGRFAYGVIPTGLVSSPKKLPPKKSGHGT